MMMNNNVHEVSFEKDDDYGDDDDDEEEEEEEEEEKEVIQIDSDEEREEETEMLLTLSKAYANKIKREENSDWYKQNCGGENCHGKSSCSVNECSCSIDVERNYPMLQLLCKNMLCMENPYRALSKQESEQKWENFAIKFFHGNEQMIPKIYQKISNCRKEWGKFLCQQWTIARNIYVKVLKEHTDNHEAVSLTPFLKQCKELIDDREIYEREVA
jgi:hypothetical protein